MLCKKHKQYRAIRKPTADCEPCRDAWEMKERGRSLIKTNRKEVLRHLDDLRKLT